MSSSSPAWFESLVRFIMLKRTTIRNQAGALARSYSQFGVAHAPKLKSGFGAKSMNNFGATIRTIANGEPYSCAMTRSTYMILRPFKLSPMLRLACLLIVPLSLLFASCDNNTQEDTRWDTIYKDLDSGGKVQPWRDAQQAWDSSDHGKNWK